MFCFFYCQLGVDSWFSCLCCLCLVFFFKHRDFTEGGTENTERFLRCFTSSDIQSNIRGQHTYGMQKGVCGISFLPTYTFLWNVGSYHLGEMNRLVENVYIPPPLSLAAPLVRRERGEGMLWVICFLQSLNPFRIGKSHALRGGRCGWFS